MAGLLISTGALLAGCSSSTTTAPVASESAAPASSAPASPAAPTGAQSATAASPSGQAGTTITFQTNRGDITIATDPKAGKTTPAQLKLASEGYFDDTPCHRLVTSGIYVLQCGDPTGTGTGGPGYALPDENLPANGADNYPAGTVAMARSMQPDTAGSQFFIVYQDTTLPADYTIWGTVTDGLDVVKQVAAAGTDSGAADGAPKEPVTITGTTVN